MISLQILVKYGNGFGNDTVVVIAGLSNTYADYVATFAEYQVRNRYCDILKDDINYISPTGTAL